MLNTKTSILGLSIGTRMMGIAVFKENELVEWRTITFKERWSKRKHRAIVSTIKRFIEYNYVGIVSMKRIHYGRASTKLLALEKELMKWCTEKNVQVRHYTVSEIHAFEESSSNTKCEMLNFERNRQQQIRTAYYQKVFEAVTLAQMSHQ